MRYLDSKQHYTNLYDLHTIERCLDVIKFWQKSYNERSNEEQIKDLPEKEKVKGFQYFLNCDLYTTQGERYRRKKETIEKWMKEDKVKQDKYDTTPTPQNICCETCKTEMHSTSKILDHTIDQPLHMQFFFECPNCKKRKLINEDGTQYIFKPRLCPTCNKEIETTYTREGNIVTSTTTCSHCNFKEEIIDDFDKDDIERAERKQKEKELLEKYREEFCLSDKAGEEFIETIEALKYANIAFDEEKAKYADPVYEKVKGLEKVTIIELEKILTPKLEKESYIKLSLDTPELGKHVVLPFTVLDAKSDRTEQQSRKNLEKLLKDILKDTNWRLMSEGVNYRLGYISGRLRGYESREDMLELVGKKKTLPPSKITDEQRMKYESNSIVQLARLSGKHEAIQEQRKKRLEKEPEGFFLEKGDNPYNCGICGEYYYGNEIWWNLDGNRCIDCWRNIKEGVIPSLGRRYDSDRNYFAGWELRDSYGVHPATAKKLRREGLLHARELKRKDGGVYYTVYLKEENKEFLKKYPKKEF